MYEMRDLINLSANLFLAKPLNDCESPSNECFWSSPTRIPKTDLPFIYVRYIGKITIQLMD